VRAHASHRVGVDRHLHRADGGLREIDLDRRRAQRTPDEHPDHDHDPGDDRALLRYETPQRSPRRRRRMRWGCRS
jgi:hypothetical protein